MTPTEFADALRWYCQCTGGSVLGWGRTPTRNKNLGDAPDSSYVMWVGADVVYDSIIGANILTREKIASRLGLMIIHEEAHDHVQEKR